MTHVVQMCHKGRTDVREQIEKLSSRGKNFAENCTHATRAVHARPIPHNSQLERLGPVPRPRELYEIHSLTDKKKKNLCQWARSGPIAEDVLNWFFFSQICFTPSTSHEPDRIVECAAITKTQQLSFSLTPTVIRFRMYDDVHPVNALHVRLARRSIRLRSSAGRRRRWRQRSEKVHGRTASLRIDRRCSAQLNNSKYGLCTPLHCRNPAAAVYPLVPCLSPAFTATIRRPSTPPTASGPKLKSEDVDGLYILWSFNGKSVNARNKNNRISLKYILDLCNAVFTLKGSWSTRPATPPPQNNEAPDQRSLRKI